MLATLIPLFDHNMDVHGYCVFAQRENSFLDTLHTGSLKLDNATEAEGFDIVKSMGISTLADDRRVYVPVNQVALFSDLDEQFDSSRDRIVLLLDSSVIPNETFLERMIQLKEAGYSFAFEGLPLNRLGDYRDLLGESESIFLNPHRINMQKAKRLFSTIFPHLKLAAIHVDSRDDFDALTALGDFDYYQGAFFRLPSQGKETELAPMKATYLELLNVVNDDDFELIAAADVISQDAALVVKLLGIVNRMTLNYGITSVRHAAAMLGQTELKRWINTAVTKELCSDKPSEISRLSLIRARFAENLAPLFAMGPEAPEAFLMGLFSVLDIMLDKPIDEALDSVRVSNNIYSALVYHGGDLAPIYHFLLAYENADWQEVSRILLIDNVDMDKVYDAYSDSLQWYRDLVSIPIG